MSFLQRLSDLVKQKFQTTKQSPQATLTREDKQFPALLEPEDGKRLMEANLGFRQVELLGEGCFGTVYCVTIPSSKLGETCMEKVAVSKIFFVWKGLEQEYRFAEVFLEFVNGTNPY